jgi:hypothetical protein
VARRPAHPSKRLWILAVVALAAGVGCTAPARGFCEAAAACDEDQTPHDRVGESDDSTDVCTADAEGALAVLRANDEPACRDLADAYEAWFWCVHEKNLEGAPCAGLRAGDDNECKSERKEIDELESEIGRACTEDEE